MRRLIACAALVGCGGIVEPSPADVGAVAEPSTWEARPAYLDATCAARPVAIVRGTPRGAVTTSEPGWHYDGSDPKVRAFDRPSAARVACERDVGGVACACGEVEADETIWEATTP